MSQEEFQAFLQVFKALADENRLKLLGILANGERSVEELAALLKLKAPTVSHHLARLRELHLVGMRSDGNTHYYWLDTEGLRQINKHLLTPEKMASLVDDIEGDAWERKVLHDFFEGTHLKEIPASVKKRGVILKWLANQFAYGVKYKEAEVNELLQRHHPDSAYLRRELISSGSALMQRDHAIYWRVSPELLDAEKRREIFECVMARFEPYKLYSEAEVNEIISKQHADYPFICRALLDEQVLVQNANGYVFFPTKH